MGIYHKLKKWRLLHIEHLLTCLVLTLLIGLGAAVTVNLSIFNPLSRALSDFTMTDVYYEMQQSENKELYTDIVLVDVTDLRTRDEIATTIDDVNACKPRVLAIDLMFERPSADMAEDASLVTALEAGKDHEVLACKLTNYDPQKDAFQGNLRSFMAPVADFSFGYCNVYQQHTGGTVRQFTLSQSTTEEDPVFSMPYLAACRFSGETPTANSVNVRPVIYGNVDFPVVKPADVSVHPELLRDKLVMLGTMTEEADMHITPIGKLSGLKIQAFSVLTCLNNGKVNKMSMAACLLLTFLLCYISAFIGYKLMKWSPGLYTLWLKLYYLVLVSLLVWLAFICFVKFGYYIPLAIPLVALALLETGRVIYIWAIRGLQKKTKLKLFSKSIYAL